MGGKTKQSQRTKNNVRPSSSGRAAELAVGGGALFPALAAPADPPLAPDYAVCFKKLTKKDPVTRTKGLQELSELLKSASCEEAETLLPHWSRAYPALSDDPDHRVREAAQICMGAVSGVAGRALGPHVRALAGPWLASTHDGYAPAAAAARLALERTFPGERLPALLAHCREALLNRAVEALERPAPAGLRLLTLLVEGLPAAHDKWLQAELLSSLNEKSAWAAASDPSAATRSALVAAAAAVLRRLGAAADVLRPHVRRTLTAAAGDSAPLVRAQLYHELANLPDWYQWFDGEDEAVSTFLILLDSEGGDARSAGRAAEALLAHCVGRRGELLGALLRRVERQSGVSSKLERRAWLRALMTCVSRVPEGAGGVLQGLVGVAVRDESLRAPAAEELARALREGPDAAPWHALQAAAAAAPPAALAAHVDLLLLLDQALARDRPKRGITFEDEAPPRAAEQPPPPPPAARLQRDLRQAAGRLLQLAADAVQLGGEPVLGALERLMRRWPEEAAAAVPTARVSEWLLTPTLSSDALLEVAFLSMERADDAERTRLLAASCGPGAVRRALRHPAAQWAASRAWLRAAAAREELVACAAEATQDPERRQTALMALALHDQNDEPVIGPETVAAMCEKLSEALQADAATAALVSADALAALSGAPAALRAARPLLSAALRAALQPDLDAGTRDLLASAAHDSLHALEPEDRDPVTAQAEKDLRHAVDERSLPLHEPGVAAAAALGVQLLAPGEPLGPLAARLCAEEGAPLERYARHCEWLRGAEAPGGPEEPPPPLRVESAARYVARALLRALLVRETSPRHWPEPLVEQAALLFHEDAVLDALLQGYSTETEEYPELCLALSGGAERRRGVARALLEEGGGLRGRLRGRLAGQRGALARRALRTFELSCEDAKESEESTEDPISSAAEAAVGALLWAHPADAALRAQLSAAALRPALALDLLLAALHQRPDLLITENEPLVGPRATASASTAEWLSAALGPSAAPLGPAAPAPLWDLANLQLCALLASALRAQEHWHRLDVCAALASTFRLLCAVSDTARQLGAGARRDEYREVFLAETRTRLAPLLRALLAAPPRAPPPAPAALLDLLADAVERVPWRGLPAAELTTLCKAAAAALGAAPPPPVSRLALAVLTTLTGAVLVHDEECLAAWSGDCARPSPSAGLLLAPLEELAAAVRPALASARLGWDAMAPTPADRPALFALLCAGAALLRWTRAARGDLRVHAASDERRRAAVALLLDVAVRLLPAAVLAQLVDSGPEPAPLPAAAPLFDELQGGARGLERLACHVVWSAMSGAGAAARDWYGAAGGKAARPLERLVRLYVTPALVKAQLGELTAHAHELEGELTVRASSREALLSLPVEERRLELTLSLSAAHPLQPPRVSAPAALGGAQWLVLFLGRQEGSLLGAARLWADSTSARVAAASVCHICYCRLQPSSGQLPKSNCTTCRNKFHTDCLFKWFASSGKTACPLCRTSL